MRQPRGARAEREGPDPVVRYAAMPPEAVAAAEQVAPDQGLSSEEAVRRLEEVGPNAIQVREVTPWVLFRRQFRSGLTILLIAAALLSLGLGNVSDGIIILFLVLLNAGLGFWQEYRATKALDVLRRMVQVEARVRRQGRVRVIPAEEIVPGDVVLVQGGDVVTADLRLLEAEALAANEAPLTGESMPVQKNSSALPSTSGRPTSLANTLFTGTTVVSGTGTGLAVATGANTYFGRTASLLRGLERPSPFQQELNRFANILLVVGLGALAVIVAINFVLGRGLLNSLLFGLALIVGVVPEALPAVTAITLSLGAADLARHNVIVKRLGALQDLSSITVICTDKTGTLTSGAMRVAATWGAPNLLQQAVLATRYPERGADPIYDAIMDYALQQEVLKAGQRLPPVLKELPFDTERKRASRIVARDGRAELIVLGAPASVMAASVDYGPVGSRGEVQAELERMTGRALRVVAVAERSLPRRDGYSLADEQGMSFLGLIGMGDPVRPGVPEAIQQASRLDVDVKMLTGDNARTALSVARQIGLATDALPIITGEQLRQQPPPPALLSDTRLFAELVPQDKLLIVQGLEAASEAVAVTGDGVNDAPALRAATVGVAVASGTAVAKEAGDLILVGDDFASLVAGIGKGRQVLAGLRKYLLYTMPGNFGLLITMFYASVLLPFLPLLPVQVLLLAVVTDLPLLAISTDIVDPEELAKPETLEVRRIVTLAAALGMLGAVFNLGVILYLRSIGQILFHTAFTYELALTAFFLAPVVRSRRPPWRQQSIGRPLLIALLLAAAFFVFLVSASSPLAALLGFARLPGLLNLAIVGYSLLYAFAAEAVSDVYYRLAPAAPRSPGAPGRG